MRRHFFIDRQFQSKYGFYIALTLMIVCGISAIGLYFGIWGSVIESFSDQNLYNEIRMAARIQDYEHSREPIPAEKLASLRLFKEVNLLSERQIEIFDEILTRSNKKLIWQSLLLFVLIGCGSIYLTHKIAGPFYRFCKTFEAIEHGELSSRIRLRRNDEGIHVAESFNRMMDSIEEKITSLKKITHDSGPAELKSRLETELSKLKTTNK